MQEKKPPPGLVTRIKIINERSPHFITKYGVFYLRFYFCLAGNPVSNPFPFRIIIKATIDMSIYGFINPLNLIFAGLDASSIYT